MDVIKNKQSKAKSWSDEKGRQRFAKLIREIKGKNSQGELAEILGVSQGTISTWISKKASPSLPQIEKVAEAANLLPEELIARIYNRTIDRYEVDKWSTQMLLEIKGRIDDEITKRLEEMAKRVELILN